MTAPEPDFADAHDRHWRDAERLFGCRAWANADYLYGLSAECGLKAVLVHEEKALDPQYKLHVDKLWPTFVSFARGWEDKICLSMLPTDAPFQNWHISQRYAHHGRFGPARVKPHRDAARAVRDMLQSAKLDGQT